MGAEDDELLHFAIGLIIVVAIVPLVLLLLPYWYLFLILVGIMVVVALLTFLGLAFAKEIENGEYRSNKLIVVWAYLSIRLVRTVMKWRT